MRNRYTRIVVFSAVCSFALVLTGAFFVLPANAQSIDVAALLKQIAELQAQIKKLQAQVDMVQTIQPPAFCHTFDEALRLGDEGSEVEALQTVLQKENVYPGLIADGVFDVPTFRALVRFQEKYRSSVLRPFGLGRGTGFMGRETIKKLNALYECEGEIPIPEPKPIPEPIVIPPIQTGSPVIDGVEGPTYLKINEEGTWTVKAYDPEKGTLAYAVQWGDEASGFAPQFLKIPEFFGQKTTFTHRYLSPGIYTVRFTVSDAQELTAKTSISVNVVSKETRNNAPKITVKPIVPDRVFVNEKLPLRFQGYDADGDNLAWSIDWGAGGVADSCPVYGSPYGQPYSYSGKSSWTFNAAPSWSNAGIYLVNVSVSDCNGGSDSYSFKVNVRDETPSTPFIYSLDPSSGSIGTKVTIKGSGFSGIGNTVNFGSGVIPNLSSFDGMITFIVPSTFDLACFFTNPRCLAPSIPVTPGTYDVSVTSMVEGKSVKSNSVPFTVTEAVAKPSITVLSPNGGEVFSQGQAYEYRWISKGVGSYVNITTCMTLESYKGGPETRCSLSHRELNTGSYKGTFGQAAGLGNYIIKIEDGSNSAVYDESDAPFSIVSSTVSYGAPEMVYPVDGQTLDYGGGYMFKVKPVAGASGYLFAFSQNGIGIYENWRDDKKLSPDGEFGVWPDNPYYSKFQEGPVKVTVRALINGQWSDERNITINLVKKAVGLPDLEVRNVTRGTDFHPYGFHLTVCMGGSKSINDLKKENSAVTHYPVAYYVYDSAGVKHKGDIGVAGEPENLKNGSCSTYGGTIQQPEQMYFDQTGKVEFTADPDNIISEANEQNNTFLFTAPVEKVDLHSVIIESGTLKVTYSKNFATCAHLKTETGIVTHIQNYFCQEGTNVTVTQQLSNFSNIDAGSSMKLCHGNNGNICSALVKVQSSASVYYPGFFMDLDKQSYGFFDTVSLTLRRADARYDLYALDVFAIPPGKDQSSKVLLQKVNAGFNTVHKFALNQHPVFEVAGDYLLLVCPPEGCNASGAFTSNSVILKVVSVMQTGSVSFKVVSPNGAEQWVQGKSYPITWTSTGGTPTVRISLYESGAYKEILTAEVPNTGSWTWNVPSATTPATYGIGSKYSIRVFNLAYPNNFDDSDNYFSIVAQPYYSEAYYSIPPYYSESYYYSQGGYGGSGGGGGY